MTHICQQTGPSLVQIMTCRMFSIWSNDGTLLIGPLGTTFGRIGIKVQNFSHKIISCKTAFVLHQSECAERSCFKVRDTTFKILSQCNNAWNMIAWIYGIWTCDNYMVSYSIRTIRPVHVMEATVYDHEIHWYHWGYLVSRWVYEMQRLGYQVIGHHKNTSDISMDQIDWCGYSKHDSHVGFCG